MRKLRNTLYITEEGVEISPSVEAMDITNGTDHSKIHIPYHMLESICVFGNAHFEDAVLSKCMEYGISIFILTKDGRYRYSIQGPIRGNVLLRKKQYLMSDSIERLPIAIEMIKAKIRNSYILLQRFCRNHPGMEIQEAMKQLINIIDSISANDSMEEIRGKEGIAAKIYFGVFDRMILSEDNDMRFRIRTRRPPQDRCNALLSFTYTLLTSECIHALECAGLDPYVGFIHTDRMGKPSLALDLVEEMRPMLADRFVLRTINLGIITSDMFYENEEGIFLDSTGKAALFKEWVKMKRKEIQFQDSNKRICKGLVPYIQANRLSSVLRGDESYYKTFEWR